MANPQPSGNGEKRGLDDAGETTEALPVPFILEAPTAETAEGCAVGDTRPLGRWPI